MAFSYSVFGLTIETDGAVPRLRPLERQVERSDVEVRLQHTEPFFANLKRYDWAPFRKSQQQTPDGQPLLEVLRAEQAGLFQFAYADGTDLVVTRGGDRIWARWRPPNQIEDTATYLLGPVMGFVLRLRGRLSLHASAALIDGFAVACAGDGGSGKSTTVAVFAQRGFPMVTDDILVLRPTGSGGAVVEPDCPIVRLWPQSAEFLYGARDALPRLSGTWDKRYLDLETRGYPIAREPQSLGAVYVLDGTVAAGSNAELTVLHGREALLALLSNAYCTIDLDAEMRVAEFDLLSRLVGQIEVRRLRQPVSPAPPAEVCDIILADWRESKKASVADV